MVASLACWHGSIASGSTMLAGADCTLPRNHVLKFEPGNSLVHVWKDPTSPEPTAPRACVLVQKPHTSVFSGVYDDHLGPSNSENDNETIKNRGDYVETTIKGPDYLTSRIYRQRFTISAEQKKEEKWKLLLFSKVVLIVTFRRTWSRNKCIL